jgi:hypothetical protein
MCGGGSDVNPQGNTLSAEDIEASNAIEERLMAEIMEEKKVVKVLLLGAGECGKSTILKQMQILHKNGWDTSEKMKFKALLLANLTDSIQSLCRACFDLEIKFDSDQHSEWAEAVCRLNPVRCAQLFAMSPLHTRLCVQILIRRTCITLLSFTTRLSLLLSALSPPTQHFAGEGQQRAQDDV